MVLCVAMLLLAGCVTGKMNVQRGDTLRGLYMAYFQAVLDGQAVDSLDEVLAVAKAKGIPVVSPFEGVDVADVYVFHPSGEVVFAEAPSVAREGHYQIMRGGALLIMKKRAGE